MARSASSAESNQVSKRKGARSVSNLTPSQLARKRANDREAQRAIRARTKDHIDRLELELDELRSAPGLNKTVQDLIRKTEVLEEELNGIKERIGISTPPSSFTSALDDSLSSASGAMPSPRTSPFPPGEYTPLPDYPQQYVPMSNNYETCASTVSSPSSTANADDYGGLSCIPTSMPTTMLPSHTSNSHNVTKIEYEELDERFSLTNSATMQQGTFIAHEQYQQKQQQQQQQWGMYPVYYSEQIQSPIY